MPSIFESYGYKIYFWSNENDEPIHVHISKGSLVANSTKIWLTRTGGWKEYYRLDEVRFYC